MSSSVGEFTTVDETEDFDIDTIDGALTEAAATGALSVSPQEWLRPPAAADSSGQFFGSVTGYVLGAAR